MKTTYKAFCARRGRDLETKVDFITCLLLRMLKEKKKKQKTSELSRCLNMIPEPYTLWEDGLCLRMSHL